MLRSLFTSVFLLIVISLSAQIVPDSIKGIVIDEKGQPIPYVNIGVLYSSNGTVSDENGQFKLFLKRSKIVDNNSDSDSIKFSIIGYESQQFLVADCVAQKEGLSITLKEQTFDLAEVVVRPQFKNKKVKGKRRTNTQRNVNFAIGNKPRQNLGVEIGKKFKVKNKTTQIEQLRFYISQNDFESIRFRIQVYKVKKGKPSTHLSTQSIVMEINNVSNGWVSFDLTPYNIITDEDFVISLQWIDHSPKGKRLSMPIIVPSFGGNHYYKYGSQDSWKRYRNMSSTIQVTMAY